MLILQFLIRFDVIPCEQLSEENSIVLLIELIICSATMIFISLNVYVESKALREPYLEYVLNAFKAR